MTKKSTQTEFIKALMKSRKCLRDEDFGEIMGVTKSAVGLWKNGKSPIPIEKFLTVFGQETLDWIRKEYDLGSNEEVSRYAEIGRVAEKLIRMVVNDESKKAPDKSEA